MDMATVMEMHESGIGYADIAKQFNVSRQCVHQAISRYKAFNVKETACVYPGLRSWMINNRVTVSKLSRMCEGSDRDPRSICGNLNGSHEMRKSVIDAILKVTGLTYEQAFGQGKGERR